MGIAAVALGLARAAIDALVAIAGGKTPQGSSRTLAMRPSTQSDVATAEALLRSARAFYYEAVESAWQAACATGAIDAALRRDVRLATTHATRTCARAVDLMYDLAGGSSVYRSSPLQRIFRDVHVATQHMMVSPATLELSGRLFLGLETDTSLL
jgi:alkylation response protein AidB-like acyl-CoA dehydrogenase